MRETRFDAVVIGSGAAGMAAALEIERAGFSCAIVEREDHLGGILMQCIHNGFGLHEFKEELTGPEFAERLAEQVAKSRINVYLGTTVTSLRAENQQTSYEDSWIGSTGSLLRSSQSPGPARPQTLELICMSPVHGVFRILSNAVVLAMGCRERNRGNVRIPGSRPAGVFTAGLAQRLVNIEGYIPGKEIVIVGSGDIGLIMARRMSWVGCHVKAVVEIMPYPSGLTRNIVQCLHDFDIPLYLSSQITNVFGNSRVEGVEITPMENGVLVKEKAFRIDCDTILLSVGLVPENELSRAAGVELHPTTGGPIVDSQFMTTVEGIFACGNVLHVHDLVDWVVDEARSAGRQVAAWLRGERAIHQVRVKAGPNVRYVNPGKLDVNRENKVYLRSMIVSNETDLEVRLDRRVLRSIRKGHVQPSEMITLTLGKGELMEAKEDSIVEIALLPH